MSGEGPAVAAPLPCWELVGSRQVNEAAEETTDGVGEFTGDDDWDDG